jgi:glycosyl transferase family 25
MKIPDLFERIYGLNLPERTDRLQHMKRELAKLDLTCESPQVKLFPAIKPDNKEPFRNLGMKGCFLSHLAILKDAKEAGLNYILILEDDALFLPDLKKI